MFFHHIVGRSKIHPRQTENRSEGTSRAAVAGNLGSHPHIKPVSSNPFISFKKLVSDLIFYSTRIPSSEHVTADIVVQENPTTFLSLNNFQQAAGPVRIRHGRAYRDLKDSLVKYERALPTLTPAQKTALLIEIQKKAIRYRDEKEAIAQRPWFLRSPFQSDYQRLEQRRNAANSLVNDVRKDLYLSQITFSQKDEQSTEDNFAVGAMAEVAKIHYTNRSLPAFFKHVSAEETMESKADKMGISQESTLTANLAGRAVATYTVSKLLGWENLVPETGFATHNDQIGYAQTSAQGEPLRKEKWEHIPANEITPSSPVFAAFKTTLDPNITETDKNFSFEFYSCSPDEVNGWVQEWTQQNPKPTTKEKQREWTKKMETEAIAVFFGIGKITASQKVFFASEIDFANAPLQKTLSKAHLLDLLTGQLDRNAGNFFYAQVGANWHAELIDNDLSFPEKFDSFEKEKFDLFNPDEKFPSTLPDLIDADTADAIAGLTPDTLTPELKKAGLTELEIEATLKRLELLKTHIVTARGNVSPSVPRLITEWNQETFEAQQHTSNNYVWMGYEAKKEIVARQASQTGAPEALT